MVARELRIAKVVIPRAPGHFSAYGMLVADLRRDFVDTWFTPLADGRRSPTIEADLRRDGAARTRRRSRRAALALAEHRGRSAPPTCAMSARSTPSRSTLPLELFREAGPRRHQAALRRGARAALRLFGAGREGRDREPARRRHRRRCASRSSSRSRRRRRAAGRRASRGTRPVYFAEAGGHVDTPTYDRAALRGRQRHRRAGAGRGIRLDHRAAARRHARRSTRFGNSSSRSAGAEHERRSRATQRPPASYASRRSGHHRDRAQRSRSPRPRR